MDANGAPTGRKALTEVGSVSATYGRTLGFTDPRAVQFTVGYETKF